MKRVAKTREPPIVIPIVVVAVDVHPTLIVQTVERDDNVQNALHATTLRSSCDLGVVSYSAL